MAPLRLSGRRARRVVLLLVAATIAGCSPVLDVHGGVVAAAGGGDPSTRATFAVGAPEAAPPGYVTTPRGAVVARRAGAVAARLLQGKGYAVSPDGKGELTVQIGAGHRNAKVAPVFPLPLPVPNRAGYTELSEANDIVEGSLVIDVLDTATGALLWHGAAHVVLDPEASDPALLERAVTAILATFPPRPAPARAAQP